MNIFSLPFVSNLGIILLGRSLSGDCRNQAQPGEAANSVSTSGSAPFCQLNRGLSVYVQQLQHQACREVLYSLLYIPHVKLRMDPWISLQILQILQILQVWKRKSFTDWYGWKFERKYFLSFLQNFSFVDFSNLADCFICTVFCRTFPHMKVLSGVI